MTPAEIEEVLDRSIRQSERYRVLSKQGMSFDEIRKTFDQPLEMQVFTWSGIRDTVMTPLDSINIINHFSARDLWLCTSDRLYQSLCRRTGLPLFYVRYGECRKATGRFHH